MPRRFEKFLQALRQSIFFFLALDSCFIPVHSGVPVKKDLGSL